MKRASRSRYIDTIVASTLALLLGLSVAFRASPITFMNRGFPILGEDDWNSQNAEMLYWLQEPYRTTDIYDASKVSYETVFHLKDNTQIFPDPFKPTRMIPTEFVGF